MEQRCKRFRIQLSRGVCHRVGQWMTLPHPGWLTR